LASARTSDPIRFGPGPIGANPARLNPLWIAAALAVFLISPATATDGCRPARNAELPIRLVNGLPLVTLTINHSGATLILDTGAERTMLSGAASDRMGLPRHMEYPRTVRGVAGAIVSGEVELPGLTIGGTAVPNFGALVASMSLPALGGVVPDGLLGADIVSTFEMGLDLPHGRLLFYKRPSCEIIVPDWGQADSVIKANRSVHDRLFFPVMLDGHRFSAIIDTGAQRTVVDSRAAFSVGVDAKRLNDEPPFAVSGVDGGAALPGRVHRFGQLVVGGHVEPNPALVVAKLDLVDADLILGIDYLRTRRLWLSYGSHRIFLWHPL